MNKELIVIKYGGGLITYKDQVCEANHGHINGLSEVVKSLFGYQNVLINKLLYF